MAQKQYGLIEGVSLLPELIALEPKDSYRVCFLVDSNQERVRKTIWDRGLWGEAHTYADWIKPLELEWVMMHNEWFQNECQKFGLPCLETGDRGSLLARVKQALQ
jgi:hypothetical protein